MIARSIHITYQNRYGVVSSYTKGSQSVDNSNGAVYTCTANHVISPLSYTYVSATKTQTKRARTARTGAQLLRAKLVVSAE